MQSHEYRVVPAPRRGLRAKGLRKPEDRFAHAVESEMNRMAAEGWEFVRSDTLPSERRQGWFSRPVTVFETVLVFRRPKVETQVGRHALPAMPPPVALTPPGFAAGEDPHPGPLDPAPPHPAPPVAPPVSPSVAAPAASRFTPPPLAPLPANDATPVVAPPGPTLTVIETAEPAPPDPSGPRLAAE